jgi:hypothetical protein
MQILSFKPQPKPRNSQGTSTTQKNKIAFLETVIWGPVSKQVPVSGPRNVTGEVPRQRNAVPERDRRVPSGVEFLFCQLRASTILCYAYRRLSGRAR